MTPNEDFQSNRLRPTTCTRACGTSLQNFSVLFWSQIRVWSVQAKSERVNALGPEVAPSHLSHERNVLSNGGLPRSDSLRSQLTSKGRLVIRKSIIVIAATSAFVVAFFASPAAAAAPTAGPQLSGVIDGLRLWLVGLLAGLATLFLTIGGVRYMLAGGDPSQIERAKSALRSAAIGYALAALSPVLVTILQSVVGS